jgi:hypothetical protein
MLRGGVEFLRVDPSERIVARQHRLRQPVEAAIIRRGIGGGRAIGAFASF